ncbi:hypothetical protein JCM16303_000983 [Sporobolomyces ruberrimus]
MPNSHLPSLLRNLTSNSSRSTASISLDSPSSSTLSNDETHSVASQSSTPKKPARRTRVATEPVRRSSDFRDSPTSTRTNSPRPARNDSQVGQEDTETKSEGARSRSSSGSSLEGLTARLHGARRGKKTTTKAEEAPSEDAPERQKGKGKERATEASHEQEEGTGSGNRQQPALASVPTILLSTDQVESDHGTTKLVTPDLSEAPPPLSVPTPFDSPSLSTHSSAFDSQPPPPPPRIKINEDTSFFDQNGDTGPTTMTFSSSRSLSDRSDENDSSPSLSDNENDNDDSESISHIARSDSHPDPRELLRSQLAKAGTGIKGEQTSQDKEEERELQKERRIAISRTVSAASQRSAITAEKGKGAENRKKGYEKRRYFILSTAGKLVYTSDADEDMASGLVGVMQAIVSIFADEGDKIRCVEVGDSRIIFLLKSPLYLVVSSSWGEPESVLRTHLDYLYLQVLSVVTLTQLQAIFSRRSNFDLRRMMEGTEPFFHSLVNSLQTSIPILTSSMEVYRLDPNVRSEIAKALDPGREVTKQLDLLYVLLLARGRLVTLLRPKKHSIHPTDLHLLLSTIYSSSPRSRQKVSDQEEDTLNEESDEEGEDDRRTSPLTEPGLESWLPICLPRFNAKGFLHAYVSFLSPPQTPSNTTLAPPVNAPTTSAGGGGGGGGIGLVLLSSDRDGFLGVKEAAEGIRERLLSSTGIGGDNGSGAVNGTGGKNKNRKGGKAAGGLVHEIEKARSIQEYSLGELAIPGLRHFVYKSRSLVQSTRPAWEGDYLSLTDRRRLITLYQQLSDTLHPKPAQSGTPARRPAQVQYLRTAHEAVLGWSTPQFELYVATSPFLPHSAVVSAAKGVSKWVEKEEQKLFLTSSPSF